MKIVSHSFWIWHFDKKKSLSHKSGEYIIGVLMMQNYATMSVVVSDIIDDFWQTYCYILFGISYSSINKHIFWDLGHLRKPIWWAAAYFLVRMNISMFRHLLWCLIWILKFRDQLFLSQLSRALVKLRSNYQKESIGNNYYAQSNVHEKSNELWYLMVLSECKSYVGFLKLVVYSSNNYWNKKLFRYQTVVHHL